MPTLTTMNKRIREQVAEIRFYKTLHILLQKSIGLLPPKLDLLLVGRMLDLGCSFGFWVRDMAAIYPGKDIIGIDRDIETILCAQDLTPETLQKNAQFMCDDVTESFLRHPCADLVHVRFLAPIIKPEDWPDVLSQWITLCRPEGLFAWTEAQLQTNSPAWEKLYALLQRALGDSTSPNNATPDITPMMEHFLRDTPCVRIREYSYQFSLAWRSEHRQRLRTWSSEVISILHPFLVAKQVASLQEIDAVLQGAIADLGDEQVEGTITIVTVVGTIPNSNEPLLTTA